jgi:hypothetical protein
VPAKPVVLKGYTNREFRGSREVDYTCIDLDYRQSYSIGEWFERCE